MLCVLDFVWFSDGCGYWPAVNTRFGLGLGIGTRVCLGDFVFVLIVYIDCNCFD